MPWLFFSKLGNPALEELARALRGLGLAVEAVHPGLAWSPLSRAVPVLPVGPRWLAQLHGPLLEGLRPEVVVYSYPDQAPLARRFPGASKVYYVQDDFRAYNYPDARLRAWEEELLPRIDLLVVVSEALADSYRERYKFEGTILVAPLAVPERFLPAACPPRLSRGGRVGVLGRISSRLRLGWLRQAVERLNWMRLELVGDVEASELMAEDRYHLRYLQQCPRCRFHGWKPFAHLFERASQLDLALLPYSPRSVNPCGSAYRFYIHLAYGAPMLATPGVAQLEEFQPLVQICRSSDEFLSRLDELARRGFDDGLHTQRWEAARANTWSHRARALLEALG
jgi:glycosyltransferase involved in cell wall biosynthesis